MGVLRQLDQWVPRIWHVVALHGQHNQSTGGRHLSAPPYVHIVSTLQVIIIVDLLRGPVLLKRLSINGLRKVGRVFILEIDEVVMLLMLICFEIFL